MCAIRRLPSPRTLNEAVAPHDQGRALWLPNLEFAPTWMSHTGLIQRAAGRVINTFRTSLGLTADRRSVCRSSDAIYQPLAARQSSPARRARRGSTPRTIRCWKSLSRTSILQQNHSDLQVNDESLRNATTLLQLAESYEKSGRGAAADTARASGRSAAAREAATADPRQTRCGIRSTDATRLPCRGTSCYATRRLGRCPVALVSESASLSDLIGQALTTHPELAENRAQIDSVITAMEARPCRSWLPTLRLTYAAGGFGGGREGRFDEFGGRERSGRRCGLAIAKPRSRKSRRHPRTPIAICSGDIQTAIARSSHHASKLPRVQPGIRTTTRTGLRPAGSGAARESYRLNEERIRRAPEQARTDRTPASDPGAGSGTARIPPRRRGLQPRPSFVCSPPWACRRVRDRPPGRRPDD